MADISQVKLPDGTTYNLKDSYVRTNYRALSNNDFDTINVTELNAGDLVVTGAARFLNTINGNISGNAATATSATKATQDGSGNTITSTYLPLAGGTMTGRLSTSKPIGQILTGTGTAAQDKGSGVTNRYVPAKWTFNTGLTATDGDIITIKIPVAGHDYGVYLSIDNGTTYYPIVCNSTGRLTTHYPVNNYITLVYEPGGSAASMFALNGGDSRITVTGGVWRVINYYDSNSNDTAYYTRRIYPNMKTGSNKIFPYTMIMQNSDGRWESIVTSSSTGTSKARNTHGFRLGTILLHYGSGTYNENDTVPTYNIWSMHSGLIDHRYSFNTANNSTSGTTGYKPVYVVGSINATDGLFYLDATWWTQTLPTSDDGKLYIYIGDAYDYYRLTFVDTQRIYWYKDGKVQEYSQSANYAVSAGTAASASSVAWGNVTGKPSTYTPSAHDHSQIVTVGDKRSTATTPNDYANKLIFQGLKTQGYIDNPGGTSGYSYLVGLRGWSDSSGGDSHELAFNNNGVYWRHGATTTWGSWTKLFTASDTYSGTLTSSQVTTALGYTPPTTDTKNTAGSTDSSSKLFLIGATSQAANPQTYSQDTAYVDTNGHLYSNSKQVVNLSDSQALTNKTYNGYTLAAACAKAVVTSIDTSASLPTSNAVKTFVEGKGYVTTDTKNTAGSTDTSSKIFLIGATSQAANPQTYSDDQVYVTSGTLQANNISSTINVTGVTLGVNSTSGTTGGFCLYGGATNTASYGIAMRTTANSGKHGYVQGDWGTYFYMAGATNRGWVFQNAGSGNRTSISCEGHIVTNGSLTLGGNTTNTSGVRQVYNETTKSLDFVFVA